MQGVELQRATESDEITTKPYRQVVGCLGYLTVCTRPDIGFSVSVLGKFLNSLTEQHWKAAMRVLA